MSDIKLPITSAFIIEGNLSGNLDHHLNNIIDGSGDYGAENLRAIFKDAVGRDSLNITFEPYQSSYQYDIDKINIKSGEESLSSFLIVKENNLPPNISSKLTEIKSFLDAVHESEHATQRILDSDGKPTDKRTFVADGYSPSDDELSIIAEVDADFSIVKTLKDAGHNDLAQTYLDIRACSGFNAYTGNRYAPSRHDTSSILSHYLDTGDVIDIKIFAAEKAKLTSIVQDKLYDMADKMPVRNGILQDPQTIMHVVQTLLDGGALEGIQKWEANNYMEAMDRLGYEADPNYSLKVNPDNNSSLSALPDTLGEVSSANAESNNSEQVIDRVRNYFSGQVSDISLDDVRKVLPKESKPLMAPEMALMVEVKSSDNLLQGVVDDLRAQASVEYIISALDDREVEMANEAVIAAEEKLQQDLNLQQQQQIDFSPQAM